MTQEDVKQTPGAARARRVTPLGKHLKAVFEKIDPGPPQPQGRRPEKRRRYGRSAGATITATSSAPSSSGKVGQGIPTGPVGRRAGDRPLTKESIHDPHPVLRWGERTRAWRPIKSFTSPAARPSPRSAAANGGLVERDMRHARQAPAKCCAISPSRSCSRWSRRPASCTTKGEAAARRRHADGRPVRAHAVGDEPGLPEHMCRFNMEKNQFVLSEMERILDALTRGLDLNVLTRGYGVEKPRRAGSATRAQSPVLGLVLPSNSPGVHTLWLAESCRCRVGLVLKAGRPQEAVDALPYDGGFPRGGGAEAGHCHLPVAGARGRRRRAHTLRGAP